MKITLQFFLLIISTFSFSQEKEVISWINNNATDLLHYSPKEFDSIIKYSNFNTIEADIYGFGEATHHNKEFSELKTSFFKFLVLNKKVKTFILEESYGACFFINEYIHGNQGDLEDLILNFRQHIWKTEEVFDLISWMKVYNDGKPENEKISIYGNDSMFNYGIDTIIKKLCLNENIKLKKEEVELLDYYSNSTFPKKSKQEELIKLFARINQSHEIIQATEALLHYIAFSENPIQKVRDQFMFENVFNIYENKKDKIFVWAHNEHIKKTNLFRDNVPSMGNHLSKKYGKKYFAVGFEFGIGTFFSFNQKENKYSNVILEKPIKNTNSEFLFETKLDVFYLDFETANKNILMNKFLSQKRDYLVIGAYGLVLEYLKYNYARDKYNDMFDGLIYIKKVSNSINLK